MEGLQGIIKEMLPAGGNKLLFSSTREELIERLKLLRLMDACPKVRLLAQLQLQKTQLNN